MYFYVYPWRAPSEILQIPSANVAVQIVNLSLCRKQESTVGQVTTFENFYKGAGAIFEWIRSLLIFLFKTTVELIFETS